MSICNDPRKEAFFHPDYFDMSEDEINELYEQLRVHFNKISLGAERVRPDAPLAEEPAILFLKSLFPVQHVKTALAIPFDHWADAGEIAKAAGQDALFTSRVLQDMAIHGETVRKIKDGVELYRLVSYNPGILEFKTADMHIPGKSEFGGAFMKEYVQPRLYGETVPSWRFLPMSSEVVADGKMLPFDNVLELIRNARSIAATICYCRQHAPEPCKRNDDYHCCLALNEWADFYIHDLKIGRRLSREEALAMIRKFEENGHISYYVANSLAAEVLCCCCDCCCAVRKRYAAFVRNGTIRPQARISNYDLSYDARLCTGCGACAAVCPVEAVRVENGACVFEEDACARCGCCVNACPGKALTLVLKENPVVPPEDIYEMYRMIGESRAPDAKKGEDRDA